MTFNTYFEKTKELVYQNYFDNLTFPLEILIELTNKCNSNCIYCYKKDVLNTAKGEMDLFLFYKVVDEINANSKSLVVLEGGEPFLHSKIFLLLEYLAKHNIYADIITNGRLFTDENISELKKCYNKDLFQLQISLDGLEQSNYFNRLYDGIEVITGIKKLNKIGIVPRIHMVITKYNTNNLIDFLIYINENIVISSLTINIVFGKVNEHLKPAKDVIEKLKKQIHATDGLLNFKVVMNLQRTKYTCNYNVNDAVSDEAIFRCTAMRSKICINHEGYVYPCVFFEHKITPFGSIKFKSILDIWNSEMANNFRNKLYTTNDKCLHCSHSSKCVQNCLADY